MGLRPISTTQVRCSRGAACGLGGWDAAGCVCQGSSSPAPPAWHPRLAPPAQLPQPKVASRCADEGGFDAVTLDEHGVMLFFRGMGVSGCWDGEGLINASWPEIQGPVDAALRIHHKESPSVHDNVWAYAGGRLRPGYPRLIGEEFKGVPGDLDSAVECHPEDCTAESLLFFKGMGPGWGAGGAGLGAGRWGWAGADPGRAVGGADPGADRGLGAV
uniref:Uncharacterized protein n=1 Tax=Terrapene triunguis TaxID=2587831 RepID=A0A674IXF3_9SAUR